MRYQGWRRGRGHDGCDLARGADRRTDQQCRRHLHRADRSDVVPRGRRDPGADPARHDVLHARRRQTLDRGRHKGVVLSILSTSTITGRAFTVPSAMAKSAVLAMTKSLAVEWGPKGVRTVAIAPGAFPTQGASGQLRPEGRDAGMGVAQSARPRRRTWRTGRSRELPDFGCRRLHQWRDGGAGRRRASARFGRRGPAAMDRRAVGSATRRARKG